MFFRQIVDEKLSQYAYLIGCQRTGEAVVIDPQRDIDRYTQIAADEDLRIVAVAETHIHADFLSGSREFSVRTGCRVFLSGEGGPDWTYGWVNDPNVDATILRDGDTFSIGNIDLRAVHTPGHTPEHMSFLVTDKGGGADEPMGMASGDFVFVGDLGRPDLLDSAAGLEGTMEPAARSLYASAKGVFELPDYLQVWPGHGAGSACGKALGAVPDTTVGYEKRFSPAMAAVAAGEETFVQFILEGQPEPPTYFGRMKRQNRDGVPLVGHRGPVPCMGEAALIEAASATDVVVVDTRDDREAYFKAHIRGSIYAPVDKTFPTVTGSYIEPEQDIVLLVDEAQLDEARDSLLRIGLDRVVGWAPPALLPSLEDAGGKLASIRSGSIEVIDELRDRAGHTVLDVRRATEHAEGHVPGSVNIAHTRLSVRAEELDPDTTYVVHCRSGARVSAAVSYLERRGFNVVAVNDLFSSWRSARPAG